MKRSGADELRLCVQWLGYQREDVNDAFTAEELLKLWRFVVSEAGASCEYGEFFDESQEAFDFAVKIAKGT